MNLMRQLEAEHKQLWSKLSPPSAEMINARDCDPTLLSGWTDRDISLWDVSAVDGKPGLQDILIALCRQKKDWVRICYLRFPTEAVSSAGLSLTASNGKTGDQKVDTSRTHFEIKGITGKELCNLLFEISRGKFEIGVFTKKQLDDILFQIYDTRKKQLVFSSATTQETAISSPLTGTASQDATKGVTSEQLPSETTVTEQKLKQSSSNTTT